VPGWWDRALAWAGQQLHPVRVHAVEQLRSSESSSVIRLDTEDGAAFLKAVAASLAREVPVTAALSRVAGSVVPDVVAVDLTQRWMLLRGAPGRPLEELPNVAIWEQAVGQYARFQLAAAAQVSTLTALGCPTLTRADLERDILEVLASDQAMRVGEPGGLEDVQVRRLRTLRPELLASAASLERTGQVSIDHGDLFPGNVLSTGETSQVVDWEDARIAHPFLSVFPLLAGARMQGTFDDHRAASERIRDAYLKAFAGLAPVAALRAAFDDAQALAAVRMAATYLRAPSDIQRAHPWMREMPAFCLRTLLESRDAAGG